MDVKTMYSEKGQILLVVDNYKFVKANVSQSGRARWRCSNKRCPAKVYTNDGDVTHRLLVDCSRLNHNHEFDATLQRQILSNGAKVKARLAETCVKPTSLIRKELINSDLSGITAEDLYRVRRNISTFRRKRPPPSKTREENSEFLEEQGDLSGKSPSNKNFPKKNVKAPRGNQREDFVFAEQSEEPSEIIRNDSYRCVRMKINVLEATVTKAPQEEDSVFFTEHTQCEEPSQIITEELIINDDVIILPTLTKIKDEEEVVLSSEQILPPVEQNTGEQVEESQIKIQEEQQQRKRKRYIRDETRLVVENELQSTSTNHISYDEEQIFGNYVASELRDLKNPENKRKLRRLINQAIMGISDMEHGNSYSPPRASSEALHAIFIPSNPLSPSEEHREYTKQEEDDSIFSYM